MRKKYVLASLKKQILARIFDLGFFFILTALVFLPLNSAKVLSESQLLLVTNFSALFFVFLFFVLLPTFWSGQTLGSKIFYIQTVFLKPLTKFQKLLFFLLKELFLVFFPILLIWLFFYFYLLLAQLFGLPEVTNQFFLTRISFLFFFWWFFIFIFIKINPSQQLFFDRWYDALIIDQKIFWSPNQQLILAKPTEMTKTLPLKTAIKGKYIDLNQEQKLAVTLPLKQNALLLAGPGTGKTSVLVEKIIYLWETKKIDLNKILALTFTRQACRSIKTKINKFSQTKSLNSVNVFTYHGFCYFFLKTEVFQADKKLNILDQSDQKQVIKQLFHTNSFTNYQEPERETVNQIISAINSLQNSLIFSWQKFLTFKKENSLFLEWDEQYHQFVWKLYQEYLAYKKKEHFYDFVDLLIETYFFLQKNPLILEKWRTKYQCVLADEFQDTNFLQYQVLSLLTDKGKVLPTTVVGDPDQTIYAWRGANIDLILNFNQDFFQVQTIKLLNNYRSQTKVVKVANSLIKCNKKRINKKIIATKAEGSDVFYYFHNSKFAQADFLIKRIKALQQKKIALSQMAILYRVNYLSGILENTLLKEGIPYLIIKGQEFFQRQEIKELLILLNVCVEPNDFYLEHVLRWIPYVKDKTITKIKKLATAHHQTIFQFLATDETTPLDVKNYDQIYNLIKNLTELRPKILLLKTLSPLLNELFLNLYQPFLKKKVDYSQRLKNVDLLIKEVAVNFSQENSHLSLVEQAKEFLVQTRISVLENFNEKEEKIKLMTVHNAKGLEFDAVFLFHISNDNFPNFNRDNIDIEEERRIFFVALTRAKNHLAITASAQHKSVFIYETFKTKGTRIVNN